MPGVATRAPTRLVSHAGALIASAWADGKGATEDEAFQ
jgi:hypothetical protein